MNDFKPYYRASSAREVTSGWFSLMGISFITGCLLGATIAIAYMGGL